MFLFLLVAGLGRGRVFRVCVLVCLVVLLAALAAFFGFQLLSLKRGDGVHPRPVVKILVECSDGGWESINGSGVVGCEVHRRFRLAARLTNEGGESGLKGVDTASGILLALKGGKFDKLSIGNFDWAIGVNETAGVVNPNGSRIVEVFSKYMGGHEFREAYFDIKVDEGVESVKLYYRGWILDEDDEVIAPNGEKQPYCARYPPENTVDNPPDLRWVGEEFMKYKTFEITIFVAS